MLLTVLAVLLLTAAGAGWWALDHYTGRIGRIPGALPTAAAPPGDGRTFLLVGLDAGEQGPTTGRRAEDSRWHYGEQRSDTVMLVRLPEGPGQVRVVSLPRDAWVPVPGHGRAKLNAAYSWGGAALLTDTVQRLTGLRVDHFLAVDHSGLTELVDAVGGIDLPGPDGTARHLDGEAALAHARQRQGLPGGDLDRIRHQQLILRELLAKLRTGAGGPLGLKGVLDAVTGSVSVDEAMSDAELRRLLWRGTRELSPADITYRAAPLKGTGTVAGQSVVHLDLPRLAVLARALREDRAVLPR
ncbi:LCP family protein [Streptomyces albidoflavus]